MSNVFVGLIVLITALACPAAVFIWARRQSRKPGAPRFVALFPTLILILGAVNVGVPMYFVASAFWGNDPSEKATLFAKGISEAMNCYAFFVILLAALAVILAATAIMGRRGRSHSDRATRR